MVYAGMPSRRVLCGAFAGVAFALAAPAQAQSASAADAFKLSGFLSIVGGTVVGSSLGADYTGPADINGVKCPCYVADWGNAGVYGKSFSLKPESRAGIQGRYAATSELSFVGQVAIRGTDGTPNVQWAYASYAPSKSVELQVGRKRIPLYFYSDFQDIGTAYPWVNPPPELYGWEATNYNGASLRLKGKAGDFNVSASLFGGREHISDSLYNKLFYSTKTRVEWNKIAGADLELTRDQLTLRAIYTQAEVKTRNPDAALDSFAKLKAYGVALNYDADDWFVLSEVTELERKFTLDGYSVKAPAYTVGLGWRIGPWTPFLNYAKYREKSSDRKLYQPIDFDRASVTLRYDLDATSGIKAQVDRQRDLTKNFGGDVTVLRLSYDRVF